MQKLETLHESLKDLLVVNDDAVESRVQKVKDDFVKESSELKATVQALENKLNESMKKELSLNRKLDEARARELIAEKTKNLPIVESKEMCRRLKGMSAEEIQKKFDTILEEVTEKIADDRNLGQEEKNLEEAISDIINGVEKAPEKNGEEVGDGSPAQPAQRREGDYPELPEPEDDGVQDTPEYMEESVTIAESQMQEWVDALYRYTPNK